MTRAQHSDERTDSEMSISTFDDIGELETDCSLLGAENLLRLSRETHAEMDLDGDSILSIDETCSTSRVIDAPTFEDETTVAKMECSQHDSSGGSVPASKLPTTDVVSQDAPQEQCYPCIAAKQVCPSSSSSSSSSASSFSSLVPPRTATCGGAEQGASLELEKLFPKYIKEHRYFLLPNNHARLPRSDAEDLHKDHQEVKSAPSTLTSQVRLSPSAAVTSRDEGAPLLRDTYLTGGDRLPPAADHCTDHHELLIELLRTPAIPTPPDDKRDEAAAFPRRLDRDQALLHFCEAVSRVPPEVVTTKKSKSLEGISPSTSPDQIGFSGSAAVAIPPPPLHGPAPQFVGACGGPQLSSRRGREDADEEFPAACRDPGRRRFLPSSTEDATLSSLITATPAVHEARLPQIDENLSSPCLPVESAEKTPVVTPFQTQIPPLRATLTTPFGSASVSLRTTCPDVIVAGKHDFIFGKGRARSEHPGNRRVREEIICRLHQSYVGAPTTKKKNVLIERVIRNIRTYGGRFLESRGKEYFPVEDEKVKRAIGQLFREATRKQSRTERTNSFVHN